MTAARLPPCPEKLKLPMRQEQPEKTTAATLQWKLLLWQSGFMTIQPAVFFSSIGIPFSSLLLPYPAQ
ncbi:MAG: hypothetical protein ACLRPT_09290 [Akkermansia muciniphila]